MLNRDHLIPPPLLRIKCFEENKPKFVEIFVALQPQFVCFPLPTNSYFRLPSVSFCLEKFGQIKPGGIKQMIYHADFQVTLPDTRSVQRGGVFHIFKSNNS